MWPTWTGSVVTVVVSVMREQKSFTSDRASAVLTEQGLLHKERWFSDRSSTEKTSNLRFWASGLVNQRLQADIHRPQKQSGTNYCLFQSHRPRLSVSPTHYHMCGDGNGSTLATDACTQTPPTPPTFHFQKVDTTSVPGGTGRWW